MRPANHNEMRHSSSLQSTDRATDSSSQSQLMGLLLEKDMSGEVVNSPSPTMVQIVNDLTSRRRHTIVCGPGTRHWTGRQSMVDMDLVFTSYFKYADEQ